MIAGFALIVAIAVVAALAFVIQGLRALATYDGAHGATHGVLALVACVVLGLAWGAAASVWKAASAPAPRCAEVSP